MNLEAQTEMHERNKQAVSYATEEVLQPKNGLDRMGNGCAGVQILQRSAINSDRISEVPPIVYDVLRSPGEPLDPAARGSFESRFGHDFSKVRVHSGPKAAESARSLNALAYTLRSNVVMGADGPPSSTTSGRRLLAHELTHVVQQEHQANTGLSHLHVGSVDNAYEREANLIAAGVLTDASAACPAARVSESDHPVIMRTPIFSSTFDISHNYLKSREFRVSQGGLVVTANGSWEAPEWQGTEPPECGPNEYSIELRQVGLVFDSPYGSCPFAMGRPVARQWTSLPEDDYYLGINAFDHRPICRLRGSLEVAQERGLTGESCTQPPPGPLEILHDALAVAGLIPALGVIPDAADTALYVIQGNWANAGISAVAMIPIFGDAARLGTMGARTVLRVERTAVRRIGRERIIAGIRAARSPVRAAVRTIPQGFTERQFARFARGARRLCRQANLPEGELVVQGSRVRGAARTTPRPDLGLDVSDIDVALRVDDATFFDLAERVLARARPGTRLRETMLDRIRRNGQLSSFDLGQEFQSLRRQLLDAESPVPVQFSVLRRGGRLDTGTFLPLE